LNAPRLPVKWIPGKKALVRLPDKSGLEASLVLTKQRFAKIAGRHEGVEG